MSSKGRPITSRTPLYYAESPRFYWNHCWYCGIELVRDKLAKRLRANAFTRDHLHPRSAGGTAVVPACNKCNKMKGVLTLGDFRNRLKKILFYAEEREAELKIKFEEKRFRPTLKEQLAALVPPPALVPVIHRCLVRRELVLSTPLNTILRRLFSCWPIRNWNS